MYSFSNPRGRCCVCLRVPRQPIRCVPASPNALLPPQCLSFSCSNLPSFHFPMRRHGVHYTVFYNKAAGISSDYSGTRQGCDPPWPFGVKSMCNPVPVIRAKHWFATRRPSVTTKRGVKTLREFLALRPVAGRRFVRPQRPGRSRRIRPAYVPWPTVPDQASLDDSRRLATSLHRNGL